MSEVDIIRNDRWLELIRQCLINNRLAHAYLFTGGIVDKMESAAKYLAKILNCLNPPTKTPDGVAIDCCNHCANCVKIEEETYPDVYWIRPESKMRQIPVESIRELIKDIQLKPAGNGWKIAIIVAADRMNSASANAFLKTLEEPPQRSVIILITTEPHRLLETIISRCQKINFGEESPVSNPEIVEWLTQFAKTAAEHNNSIFKKYKLLNLLTKELDEAKEKIEKELSAHSLLEKYRETEMEKEALEQLEKQLNAAIEAEYRRKRLEWLSAIQWFLRDIWLLTINPNTNLLNFVDLKKYSMEIAKRVTTRQAMQNLELMEDTQRLMNTNVQETLVLEVAFLRLNL